VSSATINGHVKVSRLPLDEQLEFVVVIPERTLPTKSARQALPDEVSRQDAIFNLGRMGMLLSGLADHRFLAKEATQDRLHQVYRTSLFEEAPELLQALLNGGARASCWSGAGPSLLAICGPGEGERVRRSALRSLESVGLAGDAVALKADRRGLVVGEAARGLYKA
jgi:homoserine kinase